MRRILLCLLALLVCCSGLAEEALEKADLSALEDFAGEYAGGMDVGAAVEAAMEGSLDGEQLLEQIRSAAAEPFESALGWGAAMLAPVLMLCLLGCILHGGGAAFLLRLVLLNAMLQAVQGALQTAESCLMMTQSFSDAVTPALNALLAATGMSHTAALLSPAAALAGNLAEKLFLRFGLPLCRAALCVAVAGSLSPSFDLSRAAKFMKRIVGWGTGLSFTLFTALIALQGNMAGSLDSVALRTARYAVDSASPVIGSGVSEVWESYISGVLVAKNAVGVSGVLALLAAGFRPLLQIFAALLLMHAVSVLLDVLGEKTGARAAEQMGDVCRMALELCSGALAIAMILLGAVMAAGQGLIA